MAEQSGSGTENQRTGEGASQKDSVFSAGSKVVDSAMFREFKAEKVYLYVKQALEPYSALRENSKFQAITAQTIDAMVLQIRTWCLSGRIPTRTESETVSWPDGVWQMFKHKFMPHWFIERFPVRMESREIETATHHYFVCPHLTTSDRGMHIKFMATGTDMAQYFGGQQ